MVLVLALFFDVFRDRFGLHVGTPLASISIFWGVTLILIISGIGFFSMLIKKGFPKPAMRTPFFLTFSLRFRQGCFEDPVAHFSTLWVLFLLFWVICSSIFTSKTFHFDPHFVKHQYSNFRHGRRNIWLYMVVYGYIWAYVDACCCAWLYMVVYG